MAHHAHKPLALVTGGAGFIGSQLVEALIAKGWHVAVMDDLSSGSRKNVHPAAAFMKMDIANPKARAWILKLKPKAIFHLAAQISVTRSIREPIKDAETNVIASLGLLDAASKAGVERFVFAGSGGAMCGEDSPVPMKETDPAEPSSPYGIAKYAIERYGAFYREQHGLPFVSMRFSNVYGPRQNAEGEAGVVAVFSSKMIKNEATQINGTGKQTRDFVYVEDVVAALMSVLAKPGLTGTFNVATGKETDVATLYRKIAKLACYKKKAKKGPPDRNAPSRSALDASRLHGATGWRPQTKLDDGLRDTMIWFQEHTKKKGVIAMLRCLI
jgi:UDP-glucose 4-epimerase